MSRSLSSTSILQRKVPLTSDQYPRMKRGSFSKVCPDDVAFVESVLQDRVFTDSDDLKAANTDWLRICRVVFKALNGLPPDNTNDMVVLYKPVHTCLLSGQTLRQAPVSQKYYSSQRQQDEVSEILKYCNEHNLAVVPQGVFDEIIISSSLINSVIEFSPLQVKGKLCNFDNCDIVVVRIYLVGIIISLFLHKVTAVVFVCYNCIIIVFFTGILTCQAGCILENLNLYVQKEGSTMPLDLGAKGSSYIGGNLANNTGEKRFPVYGPLHGSTLGIEAVSISKDVK
ncbi:D-2-hydroxyglutarate dehydrogenase, mitochondrial [Holothuria leucospilota]|uniref:D-2-hydroxyglutarate dehydrogenase, mitochondrial n=1 Tax=Holothuria leucospilota TaxID=206669 RepID=A0A9Q0YGU7_HOLLE|nr:D-2-hydroxyglutarate dehydrogenase, mitochondrial [Holothuria leucospilota]